MALEPLFNDIAAAIHEKDGKTDGIAAMDFPTRIRAIQSTSISSSPKDINFFDYDGTLLYSYTLSETQELVSPPKGPVHDGLIFQGWNWSLEKIKALTRPMNVGAMYITDDGKTRLKIRVWDKVRSNVPLHISQTISNGVTIDWGDGSSVETLDGTGNVNTSHQYAAAGDYTIALGVLDGCELGFGNGTGSYCVMGNISNNGIVYCNLLYKVEIGDGVPSIGPYAFSRCQSLEGITIPESVAIDGQFVFRYCYSLPTIAIPEGTSSVDGHMFRDCLSLSSITIPEGITDIGNHAFMGCYSMSSITIPEGTRDIGTSAFNYCYSLSSITIPEGISNIGDSAFLNCYGMAEYHIKPTTPPTLANANVFGGIPSDCIIYVPIGSLEAYKTAEYWSAYAAYMQEEPSK